MLHIHMRIVYSSSVLRAGFADEVYSGREGPDRQSPLPSMPCTVAITLQRAIESPLTCRLIPRTISENIDANGSPPTATLRGINASSKNM